MADKANTRKLNNTTVDPVETTQGTHHHFIYRVICLGLAWDHFRNRGGLSGSVWNDSKMNFHIEYIVNRCHNVLNKRADD